MEAIQENDSLFALVRAVNHAFLIKIQHLQALKLKYTVFMLSSFHSVLLLLFSS